MSAAKYQNKLLSLALGPILAVTVYLIGGRMLENTPVEILETVRSTRTWLLIFSALYVMNFGLAWVFRDSWMATLIRSLLAGLFGYVAISETVTIVAGAWDNVGQLLGGDGNADALRIAGLRYSLIAWTVNLILACVCIGVGFESAEDEAE